MSRTRSLSLTVGWVLCFALGGCSGGGATDNGVVVLTDAQKAEREVQDRATLEANKAMQKQAQQKKQAARIRRNPNESGPSS